MRRAGAGLIVAALLALAGCRSTDTKTGDDKKPVGIGTGRPKDKDAPGKQPTWLDDMGRLPGAGTSIPKSSGPSNPKDPNFDAKTAAQDVLGGKVLDPDGRPARNVYVRLEQLGAPAGPAEIGIYTDDRGYFSAKGLKVGQTYEVTASATPQEGKPLNASVQARVPNVVLTLVLRDDLPPTGGLPGGFTPPRPAPVIQPKPPGDAWSPGGPTNGVPPPTIGAPKPPAVSGGATGGQLPPPAEDFIPSPAPKVTRPENVADGPKDPFKPPPASIPNPNGPPVPALPPPFNPTGGGRSLQDTPASRGANRFTLLDTQERPWDSDSVRPGALVLLEFTTSTCVPCKQVIPVMKDVQSRYGAYGLQVIGVLCDELPQKDRVEAAAKYSRDQHLNYALYVEPGAAGTVRDRFDVEKYPTAVLLNAGGRVLWKGHPGDRAKLEAAIKQGLGK